MYFRNKHQTEWDIKEYLTALAFYFKVLLMLPHLTHYGIPAEQFKSLNADTMRCINNKKADASIKKQKEDKNHIRSPRLGSGSPAFTFTIKSDRHMACVCTEGLCAVERMQAILSPGL